MESVEKETKLDEQHIEFLTSRDTLKSQVGLSLKLRTLEFKKRFATKRICTTSLRNLYRKHKIKRGDTLSDIAAAYQVTLNNLRGFNSLKSDRLRVGDTLRIPPLRGS